MKTLEQLAVSSRKISPNDPPHKTAFIDVGSNSFRLIVITYLPGFHFQVTDEVRESVRLVQGLGATGVLSEGAMTRAVEVMRLYAAFCKGSEIDDIVAVATSAVREAGNRDAFLERVQRESGITVRLLSGAQEAYYGYLAAVNSTTLQNGYVFDLGGGSLEITRVEDRRNREAVSLTLGAVRTTEEWLPTDPADHTAVMRLREHVRAQLARLDWLRPMPGTQLVGQGGTFRNAARLVQKQHAYPLDELHGFRLQALDLRRLVRLMEPMSIDERRELPGMKSDRADITLAAGIVVEEIMNAAGYDEVTVCSQGLREGLFYERYLTRTAPDQPVLFADVRRASVMNVANLYRYQQKHADHVASLALDMFDQLRELGLNENGPAERELLWAACMLHDIGMTIDYNEHHRHSQYLILNSGLPGFTHRELALIALAARFHRRGAVEIDREIDGLGALLEPGDTRRLLKMTALLRLAEQLDRSRDGSVHTLRLSVTEKGRMRLTVASPTDITVALWSAQLHTDLFASAYGRVLEIVKADEYPESFQ